MQRMYHFSHLRRAELENKRNHSQYQASVAIKGERKFLNDERRFRTVETKNIQTAPGVHYHLLLPTRVFLTKSCTST